MFWNYGRRAVGAVTYLLKETNIHGIIFLSSFGCGIDSFVSDIIQRYVKTTNIPYVKLTLDEHAAEAGLNTRLEAFMDVVNWRCKEYEADFSPHG